MNAPNWITIERYVGDKPYWKLIDFWYHAEGDPDNDGTTNVYILAWNADNTPALNAHAVQMNGGIVLLPFKTNASGQAQADFPQSKDSIFYPSRGEKGPYSVQMQGNSDVVKGMGLPVARHVQYWLLYQWTENSNPLPPAPTPTEPITEERVRQIVKEMLLSAKITVN